MPIEYSAQNPHDQSLNNSGTSSGATNPMLPSKKIQRNEITLAVPAIAIDVASDRAIVVESSDSDGSSIRSSSPEQKALAKQRRELARSVRDATATGSVVREIQIGAHRAASI